MSGITLTVLSIIVETKKERLIILIVIVVQHVRELQWINIENENKSPITT